LLALHTAANESIDPQMTDFLEGEYLKEQVEALKKIGYLVTKV
jgi:ferritin heavy chain